MSILPPDPSLAALAALPGAEAEKGPALCLDGAGHVALRCARAHEICGPSRHMLALALAGAASGAVLWVVREGAPGRLFADGVARFMAPGRLVLATPERGEDILWCAEEALRAGVVPVVVAELAEPPGLTPVRRLHLAAEAGAGAMGDGACGPVALLLCPGEGGAAGVESRWHARPAHRPGASCWRLERRRARSAPPAAFLLVSHGPGRLRVQPAPPA